ncbi:MAG: malate synthase, partial [Gemmatimonadota bacterium]
FYLPKLESHREARLWNDVFDRAQDALGIPRGAIRATVLIETLPAALEMDEILSELREHAAGLNAGRWDYIFSFIRTFPERPEFVLPDRAQVTMSVPFMRAYTELLVRTCHRRGAHAIGGMAAFIPSRDPDVNERALAAVRNDKARESADGFDGTWVAHPALVTLARDEFEHVLGDADHQKHRLREEVAVTADQLLDVRIPGGRVSAEGVENDVSVGLRYVRSWLDGLGAVNIFNLMEDTATAEIARSQLWQWKRHGIELAEGGSMDPVLYRTVRERELERIRAEDPGGAGRLAEAAELLDSLVLSDELPSFLTHPGYDLLE